MTSPGAVNGAPEPEADTGLVSSIAARVYLCLGLVAIGAYPALGGPQVIYESFGLYAAGGIVAGIVWHRPKARVAWVLIACSQVMLGVGDIVYFNAYGAVAPYPSAADGLYLAGIVTFGVGILLLVSRPEYGRDVLSYFDALVIAVAVALFAWLALFHGSFESARNLADLVSLAYPVLDLLVLAALLRMFFVHGGRTIAFYGLASSVVLLLVSDATYVIPSLSASYVPGTWRDCGWLGSYLLVGAVALHPSMRTFVVPRPSALHVRRVVLLGVAVVLAAVSAMLEQALTGTVAVYPIAGFAGAVAVFVVVRVVSLIRTLERATAAATESERRFRMIFERAPIGISVGRDGIMSETNPTFQAMLGYTGEELAGMHYTEITEPDERWLEMQQELNEGTRDRFAIDKRYIRKDGEVVNSHVHVALDLEDGLGISLIEDVTERLELEEQLRQSQKMEAIGKLAGGVAHDFNNLMTAVIGYSDLLLRQFEPGDTRSKKVDAIRDAAVRAGELTHQLLAFGRRQLLQVDEVDLRDVLERMDMLLRRLIGEHIHLETKFSADEIIVRADKTQLEQVVMNLAVNARDAMPDGGTLTIAALEDGEQAILAVIDDGSGMDSETLARIYEPFFTTKPLGEGTGLGLSTVHGIVGQTGGTIEVESALGEGTIFTIRLPLAHPALQRSPALATLVD
jgi:PAS domain S-box-containing protein